MDCFSEEEEFRFFDAQEEIPSTSGENFDGTDVNNVDSGSHRWLVGSFPYRVWIQSPKSVKERRIKFMEWMTGSSLDRIALGNSVNVATLASEGQADSIRGCSETFSTTSSIEDEFSSSRSSMSSWSGDNSNFSGEFRLVKDFLGTDANLDGQIEFTVNKMGHDGMLVDGSEADSDQLVTVEGSENNSGFIPSSYQVMNKGTEGSNILMDSKREGRKSWWKRFIGSSGHKHGRAEDVRQERKTAFYRSRIEKVKVRLFKKQSKQLSALYMGQDIQAHEGSILTMKFSPDGQYLASAGEDGIVRLWQVVEDERCNGIDIPEMDPTCIYFTVNHLSDLTPICVDKEKIAKLKSLKKTPDSACVIFPPKVFRLLEKPLHEFRGHSGEVLDLSWSGNNFLLSSSVDKTVRLWQVGYDQCLKVFSHNNYVTCVQFNPVDENYFISGSIDGKVRIWAISDCQVVDWIDIKEIVTAVCYRPNGQGGIVGSLTGNCRFYNISGNQLQFDAQLSLCSKKKSTSKRITGFQFLPQDSSKVMVTCANSQVKILDGLNVVGKYKGLRNAGSQLSACFTSDGKHIVSVASDDANVYLWNFSSHEGPIPSQPKKIKSFERFESNASIAIPWSGLKGWDSQTESPSSVLNGIAPQLLPVTTPAYFSLGQEYFLESFPKGTATWPEEKLPGIQAKTSAMPKSQYKFLKSSCESTSNSHAWGLVIVTAGWDGRIKSFVNYGLPVAL